MWFKKDWKGIMDQNILKMFGHMESLDKRRLNRITQRAKKGERDRRGNAPKALQSLASKGV